MEPTGGVPGRASADGTVLPNAGYSLQGENTLRDRSTLSSFRSVQAKTSTTVS